MTENALEVQSLAVSYGKIAALQGASIVVPAGGIVSVIGANGAGKSTMLNAIMGVIPSTGRVRFNGTDIADDETETRVEAGLALIPERRDLFGDMSVEDNLLLGAYSRHKRREKGIPEDLQDVFDRFSRLRERRGQFANTLSGGERQMLAVGRALMARPKLLMLDEPSLGLAPRIVREVLTMVSALRDTGVAILLVEQNARAALKISDYGYVLETGNVIAQGPSAELAQDRRIIESYLGGGKTG